MLEAVEGAWFLGEPVRGRAEQPNGLSSGERRRRSGIRCLTGVAAASVRMGVAAVRRQRFPRSAGCPGVEKNPAGLLIRQQIPASGPRARTPREGNRRTVREG